MGPMAAEGGMMFSMANDEHISRLLKGVVAWNAWIG
jgi:hypothetical protein